MTNDISFCEVGANFKYVIRGDNLIAFYHSKKDIWVFPQGKDTSFADVCWFYALSFRNSNSEY